MGHTSLSLYVVAAVLRNLGIDTIGSLKNGVHGGFGIHSYMYAWLSCLVER